MAQLSMIQYIQTGNSLYGPNICAYTMAIALSARTATISTYRRDRNNNSGLYYIWPRGISQVLIRCLIYMHDMASTGLCVAVYILRQREGTGQQMCPSSWRNEQWS